MTDLRDSLAQVQELVKGTTPGLWKADGDDAEFHTITITGATGSQRYACSVGIWQTPRYIGQHHEAERVANAALIVAAVNLVKEHGPALLAMMEERVND